jgi:GDP-L-fucose synthase
VTVWGTGTPHCEFLHVDDLADALVFMMENYSGEEIGNVGTGEDLTIRELCEMVREAVGYKGGWCSTSRCPTGRRGCSWMCRGCGGWGGGRGSGSRKGLEILTVGMQRTTNFELWIAFDPPDPTSFFLLFF